MRVVVQVIGGPSGNKRFVLQRGQEATFGRTQNADHAFPEDPRMSSVHFHLRLTDAGCVVRDNNSTNGTFVDDQRIVERTVHSDCTLRAGDTRFSLAMAEIALAPFNGPPAGRSSVAASTGFASTAPPSTGSPFTGSASVGSASVAPPSNIAAPHFVPSAPVPQVQRLSPVATSSPVATLRADAELPEPTNRATLPAPATDRWRSLATKEYEIAVDDEDVLVRRNALLAATWKRQKWVLEWCRLAAARPDLKDWDGLLLLAVLGQSEDLARIQTIGRQTDLGPRRFFILGAYGHPRLLPDILASVGAEDEMDAFAARAAFTKITSLEVPLKRPLGSKPDAAPVVDTDAAFQMHRSVEQQFPGAFRLCRGFDISRGTSPAALAAFDLESRWEACLRGRFQNNWQASPLDDQQLADALSAQP